ncbi:hypothetical protein KI387_024533 [Taxus chinensis]|uniref:N-acyl-L-amino-acid amidohydrolase n=1 Tax=Taxus chinensis TaxID=29808 RepID=A0AA38L958_TAXCH|nr:hypothetical protein KI387_024533 [Taxus chinensis]
MGITQLVMLLLCGLSLPFCTLSSSHSAEDKLAIARFQQYLKIATAHPNPNYKPAQEFILSQAGSVGINTQVLEFTKGKPLILLTWTGKDPSRPSILLNSHMDSVPAEADKWVHDPIGAVKDNSGNIYARGAQDDKCIGMQYLEAIKRLKSQGFQPLRTIHISYVPDEEIGGMDGSEAFVKSKEFENLHVGFVLDEGQASPNEHYRVFYADRIPWRLIIKATGAPGRGSKLYDNSALENLMKSMEVIGRFRSAQFDLVKSGMAEHGEVIAVNPVYVKAGTPTPTGFVMNLQPSEAEAGFDIRLPPTADPQLVRERISEEWAPAARNMTYELMEKGPLRDIQGHLLLTVANHSNLWWLQFEKAISAAGGKLGKPEILASTTDARFVREKGIPAFGFSPMSNTPILLHDHNEFLNEAEYLKGIKMYIAILEILSSYTETVDDIAHKDEL